MVVKANAAGKHVLCEKPMAMDSVDAERLRTARPDRLIIEAFMVRFHEQWRRARAIAQSGQVGDVRAINASFTYHSVDPKNLRNRADVGGGALLDIGCYCIAAARFLIEAESMRALAFVDRDPIFGTDRVANVLLDFTAGRRASFLVSTQLSRAQSLEIFGAKGKVYFSTFFLLRPVLQVL